MEPAAGRGIARAMRLVVLALAGGCASTSAPLHFPARTGPAITTSADDDALATAGYVSLGPLEVEVEQQRCRAGTPCEGVRSPGDSTSKLLARAAEEGGELVRVAKDRIATTAPWTETKCGAWAPAPHLVSGPAGARVVTPSSECADEAPVAIGTRHLQVSAGTVWRKEPALVPNMLLARAVERGDEASVAQALLQVKTLDAYIAEPPLVIAARRGHAAVVRQLLAAGAQAGREGALHLAVKRGDPVIVGLLLSAGTSAGAADPETREQPLHVAAQYEASAPLVPVLIAAGADVDALDSTDRMPLQHAILACNFPAARALIAAGANTGFALADDDTVELSRKRCPGELAAITALASRKR